MVEVVETKAGRLGPDRVQGLGKASSPDPVLKEHFVIFSLSQNSLKTT